MTSTFTGIEISKRSLFAQQAALQTTGHNISNANTQGYSRQVVNFVASAPLEAPSMQRSTVPGQMGQGVEFDQIKRVREKFMDTQFYDENKTLGEWNTRKDTLEKLEAIVNEPSDTGVRQVIEGFWSAWQDVSKEPDNLTARAALKEKALAMTDALNHTGKQLDDLKNDLTDNISVEVGSVNTMLTQVANLNREIFRTEGLGNNANDLRDQRDLLVDNISKIVNVSATETSGGYTLKMGSTELVNGINVSTELTPDSLSASLGSGDLQSGEIYGMFVSRDQYVASYKFQFDSMVKSLVQGAVPVTLPAGSVIPPGTTLTGADGNSYSGTLAADTKVIVNGINGMHQLGYTLEDPPKSGIPFFTLKEGATDFTADSITVNPDIVKKVANIAASSRTYVDTDGKTKVVRGNNDIALALAGMQNQKFDFDPNANGTPLLTNGTFDEFLRAIVGQLGVQSQEATRQTTNQQALVDQVDSRRQSVSGVSLDEEMANMIKFQQSYNAAARALTTFDEMLDKVINSMGTVGR
ncbi:flagellar hook-associated protein FlgK [Paenibacillus pectinilyticus]|uniref:Flagellar hook-associated protein 1 n=1 Tax=Paenibacillus pectinilyticus TaxID=512399 RepID=A0A1C0ZYE9_9BACL|nr:flagellar hook-associated protein FlgK [Paenibacillus pectinilyticus]OCT13149.1 flagellar hook-associated protein FlgK [Paenibacillus pectinilyticus]